LKQLRYFFGLQETRQGLFCSETKPGFDELEAIEKINGFRIYFNCRVWHVS
jgi:hypothetical protein